MLLPVYWDRRAFRPPAGLRPRERITMNDDLALGLQEHQRGLLDQAALRYRNVLRDQPDHPEALHLLGVALIKQIVIWRLDRLGRTTSGLVNLLDELRDLGTKAQRVPRGCTR